MKPAMHPLASTKAQLLEAVRHDDAPALASLVRGRGLPFLGGHEQPAALLYRSLAQPPTTPELPRSLSRLTAELVHRFVSDSISQQAPAGAPGPDPAAPRARDTADEPYLFNLLLFSSYLPAEPLLFSALKELRRPMLATASPRWHLAGRTGRQLLQTLGFQQTDASLERDWLELLGEAPSTPSQLDDEDMTRLVDSWTGLLWVPPTPEQRAAATTVNIERIARGLEALDATLEDTPDHLRILRWAVRTLDNAYPRDPRFWAEKLEPYLQAWEARELLLDVLAERWPVLEHLEARAVPSWNPYAATSHHLDLGGGELIPPSGGSPGYDTGGDGGGASSESTYAAVDSEVSEVSEAPPDTELDAD